MRLPRPLSFQGRAGRLEWLTHNLALAAGWLYVIGEIGPVPSEAQSALGLSALALFGWLLFSVAIRRLHDVGLAVMEPPRKGALGKLALGFMARGDRDENRFGPPPGFFGMRIGRQNSA